MSANQKRAYAEQLRGQKIIFYKRKIKEKIDEMNKNLLGFDYSGWLEALIKDNPADRAAILAAEREAYQEMKKA